MIRLSTPELDAHTLPPPQGHGTAEHPAERIPYQELLFPQSLLAPTALAQPPRVILGHSATDEETELLSSTPRLSEQSAGKQAPACTACNLSTQTGA